MDNDLQDWVEFRAWCLNDGDESDGRLSSNRWRPQPCCLGPRITARLIHVIDSVYKGRNAEWVRISQRRRRHPNWRYHLSRHLRRWQSHRFTRKRTPHPQNLALGQPWIKIGQRRTKNTTTTIQPLVNLRASQTFNQVEPPYSFRSVSYNAQRL